MINCYPCTELVTVCWTKILTVIICFILWWLLNPLKYFFIFDFFFYLKFVRWHLMTKYNNLLKIPFLQFILKIVLSISFASIPAAVSSTNSFFFFLHSSVKFWKFWIAKLLYTKCIVVIGHFKCLCCINHSFVHCVSFCIFSAYINYRLQFF